MVFGPTSSTDDIMANLGVLAPLTKTSNLRNLISSCLDYYNSLHDGLTQKSIHRLLLTQLQKCNNITPVLASLHLFILGMILKLVKLLLKQGFIFQTIYLPTSQVAVWDPQGRQC